MSKKIRTWFIIAASLIVLGLILFVCVMNIYNWDFTMISTMKYETNTYEIRETFDKISINVDMTRIEFVLSNDESCSIVCFEAEKEKHTAEVKNGTLVIDTFDSRDWYDHIGFFISTPNMKIYLPKDMYASLSIETHTGDIIISKDFTFENLEIKGSSADVDCYASVSNIIDIKLSTGDINVDGLSTSAAHLRTTTGRISLNSVVSNGKIDLGTTTGSIKLIDVRCIDFTAESNTGRISLENFVAAGSLAIENHTGNVRFENADASQISVKTNTGDVTGTLLSEKVFITKTSTGKVNVPQTDIGGKCEITTSTGNIKISITT